MEEPAGKGLAPVMHKQLKAAYISCGMAAIVIGLIAVFCYFSFTAEEEPGTLEQPSEVYILKDEVVDTSYLHGSVLYH